MKTCSKCGERKPRSEFHKDKQKSDGRLPSCKSCKNAQVKLRYHTNTEARARVLEYQREYRSKPENKARRREYMRLWKKTPKGRESAHKYNRRHRLEGATRKALNKAIKDGKIVRPNRCENCGADGRIEAHHHKGYERKYRYDVQWLCVPCHNSAERAKEEP